jgi:serine phosphatase RsbU (regulator of sigma subunit)/anti-anti-sigma regulatory factor
MKPSPAPSSGEHETLARTGDFEVLSAARAAYTLITLRGRFTEDLLGLLQRQVLMQVRNLAVDVSGLAGITMTLARSLYYAAQALRGQGCVLVLISPPDSLRGFLKLLDADKRMPMLLSESQMPAKPQDAEAVAAHLDRELLGVKRELESNALWQHVDRESCWVCPFCGELRDSVRVTSRVNAGLASAEKVWRHLHLECRGYVPGSPRYRSQQELHAKVRESNETKLQASKGHVEALRTQVAKLEEKHQWAVNLEKGVKIAASRQRKLLPTRTPQVAGCEIAHTYRPAEDVSGDFYDFVELEDGRVAFVIGDVSGHGIEAGILMGMTKKVLSIRLAEMGDPVAAVKKTNADIVKDMDRSSFVTVAAIMFDPKRRTLTCARAGHNPPLLFNPARGPEARKFEAGGLMIGMAPPAVFDPQMQDEVMTVQPGDLLLLYTDGIEEGKNPAGEEFGVGRIQPVLQAEWGKPGAYVLGALFYEFERFAAGTKQEDDLTAVCVKFK